MNTCTFFLTQASFSSPSWCIANLSPARLENPGILDDSVVRRRALPQTELPFPLPNVLGKTAKSFRYYRGPRTMYSRHEDTNSHL